MIHYSCDQCGRKLAPGEPHYEVKMQFRLVNDPLENTEEEESDVDHLEELGEIIQQMELNGNHQHFPEQKKLKFELCAECSRKFEENPLGRDALAEQIGFSQN
ncbi:Hypothetical protein PBC10988_21300 [Planctomycetales bacterium 10988]|nr:Hypothetical protein PBC10988_21300 [Planctomycetales bacterium 10988]